MCGTDENRSHKIASIYKWIGIVYKDNKDHSNALVNLQKSLAIFDSTNDKEQVKYVLDEIGSVYNNKGILEKAIEYHSRSVMFADTLQWKSGKAISEYLIAKDYYVKREYKTANKYNDEALAFLTTQVDIKPISESELLASRIDSATGDGSGAYMHYKNYVASINKLQGEAIRKEAQKESFQNELKKKEIEEQKKDIEAKRVKDQQYLAIAALGIIIIAVLIIVWIQFRNNKNKQTS